VCGTVGLNCGLQVFTNVRTGESLQYYTKMDKVNCTYQSIYGAQIGSQYMYSLIGLLITLFIFVPAANYGLSLLKH